MLQNDVSWTTCARRPWPGYEGVTGAEDQIPANLELGRFTVRVLAVVEQIADEVNARIWVAGTDARCAACRSLL